VDVGVGTEDIAQGDLNLDGDADLVVTSKDPGPRVFSLLGSGAGAFVEQPGTPAAEVDELLVSDVTGDGLPDALTWSDEGGGDLELLAGDGQGRFGAASVLLAGPVEDVAVGDLDLDGELDIAASQPEAHAVEALLRTGSTFTAP